MFLYISNKQFERILDMVSDWKKKFDELVATIAAGSGTDQATKDAVKALQDHVATNDASEADLTARVAALETAESEAQDALTEIVTKLQANDTAGALAAAQAAQTAANNG